MALWAAAENGAEMALVDRAREGEGAAFTLLMQRHNQRLYRMVRAILRDEGEAEDVMQEAYVAAYQHLTEFEGRASFRTWLGRIAIHAACKRLRFRRRFESWQEGGDADCSPAGSAGRAADPEQEAARTELRRRLEAAVDRLPAGYRTVVMMRDVEEMSTAEVASFLQLSPANVKVRLHRARALLRRELGGHVETLRGRIFEFPAPRCRRLAARVSAQLRLAAPAVYSDAAAGAARSARAMASSTA